MANMMGVFPSFVVSVGLHPASIRVFAIFTVIFIASADTSGT